MKILHDKHSIESISKAFTLVVVGCALTLGLAVTIAAIIAKISFNLVFTRDELVEKVSGKRFTISAAKR